ncbi:glycosyltransferase family 8 protein [Candidatus Saccharibacteria bacterium]|nr:glycosyltransferase family 8 protein [Candidatus Saccharibacteria bacterium]
MNILYCGDRGIEKGVLISTLSILKYTSEPLKIFILTAGFETEEKKYLPVTKKFCQGLEKVLKQEVHLIDATDEFIRKFPHKNGNTSFTPGCMLRLYADMFSELPDRVLYLDNDIVALKDPAEFYNMNIEGHEITGVLDNYGAHFFHQDRDENKKDYLNSGVLLLNMKMIRETGLFAEARAMCRTKKMFMPDQSSINELCHTKQFVPRKYNEQAKIREDTVFRHYTTTFEPLPFPHPQKVKPWQIDRLHDILKEHSHDDILALYEKYYPEIKDE